ncbi:hypothetical protein GTQ34_02320 [Muricauda sp. JGD-17]|uniref:Right-handed parallel beta-helix repeat-containing protein n=1 Tax=Flagellimonas ochracea TaxID=2696472 RepID=A0A964WWF4_9FLAO|nr:choice-of-anchor Q domain-containing protein [Allomuricauda ochracea]NAY90743.1 hypothetical protein [Allomuricauda ochracea]
MAKHSFSLGLAVALTLISVFLLSSCREDFNYVPSSGNLRFSKDTVFLDTVFTNIGSSTYTLKVYNTSDEDILIPFVGLENGQKSSYRLNVDGIAGKEFEDIPLLARDSLFVFIETTFDISETFENEFLYTEDLLFGSENSTQKIALVTLVKDAIFLFPSTLSNGSKQTLVLGLDEAGNEIKVQGFVLEPNQLAFTNEKPYVIYGYAAVAESTTLTMEPGTRVHFHNNSGIVVNAGANLQINGALSLDQELLENEVIFEGDRLETTYANEPGQWGTVWIQEGSVDNQINHLTLKNGTTGLRVQGTNPWDTPTLTIRNSQIYNSLNSNFWATSAFIIAENTVLGSAGNTSLTLDLGGNHQFTHCTVANYWSNGFRAGPALQLSNSKGLESADLVNADFINCIVGGSSTKELALTQDSSADFNFRFQNCLIQLEDADNQFASDPLFDFDDAARYLNILLNQPPNFLQPFQNQFQIGPGSAAIDAAEPNIANPVPMDILGNNRSQNPDIGAYEFVAEN